MPAAALRFRTLAKSARTRARVGVLATPHGDVRTPGFAPVGTQASVKTLMPEEVRTTGADVVLANTYHLSLRPGDELIARLGGLHRFMAWNGPIITDSGGFQVFSLGYGLEQGVGKIAKIFPTESPSGKAQTVSKRLAKVDAEGVTFVSHLDGSRHRLTPERSIEIQENLGADIVLAFDECTSPLASYEYTAEALERTHRWAERSLRARRDETHALFGIVQGGEYRDLRELSARVIGAMPFDGFAVGGSLGKSKEDMHHVLEWTVPLLPEPYARHLLGIGEPEDILQAVRRGIDLFDCVAPTRVARHGLLYTFAGKLNIRAARFREDPAPVEIDCDCAACSTFSRAYLRHLFIAGELLGYRLATLHNLRFMGRFMERVRAAIAIDQLEAFTETFLAGFQGKKVA